MVRIGSGFDASLTERVYDSVLKLPLKAPRGPEGLQPIRDLDVIRTFLTSPGPVALFDLPWIPIYLGLCFAFHFYIGLTATVGALVIIASDTAHRGSFARAHPRRIEVRRCPQRLCRTQPQKQRSVSCARHDWADGGTLARRERCSTAVRNSAYPT